MDYKYASLYVKKRSTYRLDDLISIPFLLLLPFLFGFCCSAREMTTPASAPPFQPVYIPVEPQKQADPDAIIVRYYDCTEQTISLTLVTSFIQDWDVIRVYCQKANTRTVRFERTMPPIGALFAIHNSVVRREDDDVRFNIQWYGHENKVVASLSPNDRIWEKCHTLFKQYCLENALYSEFDRLPRYRNLTRYVRSIVSNNTMQVPLYPEQVKANNQALDKLTQIYDYMGMTSDLFKDRVMRGFSATSGIPIEGSTDEKKTYIASFYHEQLMNALDHVGDRINSIEKQKTSIALADGWKAFKAMLEAEPKDKEFDDDLLHRIEDVLEHPSLPVEDKNYISVYKQTHDKCFVRWDNLFVYPHKAPFKYKLRDVALITQGNFLNNFNTGSSVDLTKAGGGRSKKGKDQRLKRKQLYKLLRAVKVELANGKYNIDPTLSTAIEVSFKAFELYDKADTATQQSIVQTARNQLEKILQTEMQHYQVDDPMQLPSELTRVIGMAAKGLGTLT